MGKTLLLRWIFPSLVSLFLFVSPAEAAQLQYWRYETSQNRLSFTTQGGVQPSASLLSNPTRLVIDLPGTTLGSVTRKQSFGGAIREIRLGQFDAQTARIVVELADGYTLDPQMVQFRGISPTEWTVQLPSPQAIGGSTSASTSTASRSVNVQRQTRSTPSPSTTQTAVQPRPTTSQTSVDDVEVRDDGIVLHTGGQMPQIEFKRSQDGTWMTVDVLGATLTSQSSSFRQRVSKDGVSVTQVTQLSNSPPVVRVIMSTPNTRQNWEARPSAGGVAIWPSGSTPPAIQVSTNVATIESIELQNQTYFVIKADQPLNYTHGWDRETGAYGITFFAAKLPENIQLPQREVGGPILSTRVRQEDPETFTLLVEPATRVKIGQPSQNSAEQLIFPMGMNLASVPPVPPPSQPSPQPPTNTRTPSRSPRPLLPPRQSPPSRRPLPFPPRPIGSGQPTLPRIPQGRVVVMIDPGHGGSDVGAVGVGGLREKDVVMPISQQVAQILEQNGVSAVMTRTDDRTVELEPRVQMANRLGATLFVSIHANAASRAGATGIETFYYQSGYSLAGYIQNSILANFNMTNRGVKQARFYVLRNTSMPSALVEVGFLTNSYDASVLADPAQRSRMAQAIAQGILQYIKAAGY
jgi:N-acetylmuramoyl-L-alanine amidase